MADKKKILLRLPAHLHDAVRARAKVMNVSINSLLERYITRGVQGAYNEHAYSEIVEIAQQEFGPKFLGLLLFGSRARGDAHDTSDTDILMVVDSVTTIDRSTYRRWDNRLPDDLSLQIAHLPASASDASSLWLECALDGRILHDPTGRIASFLRQAREYITSGNVVRRTTHGQGFWVPL